MIVKKLSPQDFDATMIVFHYYRDEAIESLPYIEEEYDENTVIQTVRNYSILASHCWFNLYEGQRPVGFIGGFLSHKDWNEDILKSYIQFVYIIPEHRSLENFKMLVDAFTQWAERFGSVSVSAGDIGINPDRMRKLYEHLGFKNTLTMIKEL